MRPMIPWKKNLYWTFWLRTAISFFQNCLLHIKRHLDFNICIIARYIKILYQQILWSVFHFLKMEHRSILPPYEGILDYNIKLHFHTKMGFMNSLFKGHFLIKLPTFIVIRESLNGCHFFYEFFFSRNKCNLRAFVFDSFFMWSNEYNLNFTIIAVRFLH